MREVYATGFGPFEGVPENPSSIIVSQLANVHVLDLELEVSTVAVDEAVHKYVRILKEAKHEVKPIVLHFGVATGATIIRLEQLAKNIADFRIPDVQGSRLVDTKILPSCPDIIETTVDLKTIPLPHQVTISKDAGEYLCNYLYFKSMVSLTGIADVLFIHVPTFDVMPDTIQVERINQLVSLLSCTF